MFRDIELRSSAGLTERIGPEIIVLKGPAVPSRRSFPGQANPLGTPCYAAPGCEGPTTEHSLSCPTKMSAGHEFADLTGSRNLLNKPGIELGHELPADAGEIRRRGRRFFFSAVIGPAGPGSRPPCCAAKADVASIDCVVNLSCWRHYRQEEAVRVRITAGRHEPLRYVRASAAERRGDRRDLRTATCGFDA